MIHVWFWYWLIISSALKKNSSRRFHTSIYTENVVRTWPASEPQSVPLVSPDGELLVQRERQAHVKGEKQHRELMNDCFSLKERLAEERVPGPLLLTSPFV